MDSAPWILWWWSWRKSINYTIYNPKHRCSWKESIDKWSWREPNGFRPQTVEITVSKSTRTALLKSTGITVSNAQKLWFQNLQKPWFQHSQKQQFQIFIEICSFWWNQVSDENHSFWVKSVVFDKCWQIEG